MRAPGSYAGLTVKQAELLSFLRLQEAEGKTPSYEEMQRALGFTSKSGVFRLIAALEERGYITSLPNRARSIQTVDRPHRPIEHRGLNLTTVTSARLLSELQDRGMTFDLWEYPSKAILEEVERRGWQIARAA